MIEHCEQHNYYDNYEMWKAKYKSLLIKYKALKEKLNQGSDSQVSRYSV